VGSTSSRPPGRAWISEPVKAAELYKILRGELDSWFKERGFKRHRSSGLAYQRLQDERFLIRVVSVRQVGVGQVGGLVLLRERHAVRDGRSVVGAGGPVPAHPEPAAIYAVPGFTGPDGLFEAVRVDVKSGARASVRIMFGPNTDFMAFDSSEVAGVAAIELRGVSLPRPTFHLFTVPGGSGPGFHRVESATGIMRVVAGTPTTRRTLLTRTVVNSRRMPEMGSLLAVDRARRLAAFLWQRHEGWTLYVFSLAPA
jgi:hypothetical protein